MPSEMGGKALSIKDGTSGCRLPDALSTVARIWSIQPSNNSTTVQSLKYGTVVCRLPNVSSIVATLWETSSGVRSLSLEDPWLAAALGDGSVAMLQTDAASKHAKHAHAVQPGVRSHSRLFQMPQGATCCVDLSDQWLVAGSGESFSTSAQIRLHYGAYLNMQVVLSWIELSCFVSLLKLVHRPQVLHQ